LNVAATALPCSWLLPLLLLLPLPLPPAYASPVMDA